MDSVTRFLEPGHGSGDGSGSRSGSGSGGGDGSGHGGDGGGGHGHGLGSGSGLGYGDGAGTGSGHGNGSGTGSGHGDGSSCYGGRGIASVNGEAVHIVDGTQTIIRHARGNIARGFLLGSDLSRTPCFVVKDGDGEFFAHGKTLEGAFAALAKKQFAGMDEDGRVAAFLAAHGKAGPYPNTDLFEWHGRLTGSCLMGREQFAKDHGIDMGGEMTVAAFCLLTRGAYGGGTVMKIEEAIKKQEKGETE
jgi:hypothetical protein